MKTTPKVGGRYKRQSNGEVELQQGTSKADASKSTVSEEKAAPQNTGVSSASETKKGAE